MRGHGFWVSLGLALALFGAREARALEVPERVSSANWKEAEELLAPEILIRVKDGDLSFDVVPTTSYHMRAVYAEATRRGAGKVRLTEEGELEGYVAGRPFPEIDIADPKAGEKIAWNIRYRDTGTTIQEWGSMDTLDGDRVQRSIKIYYAIAWGAHRAEGEDANIWRKDGMLYKELTRVLAPLDLKDMTTLKHRPVRDHDQDIDWVYTTDTRRVRRIVAPHEEQAAGSELLNEDFWGFSGYLRDHEWKLVGRTEVLAPMGGRTIETRYGGRNGWYPVDPWEVRKAWVLDVVPRSGSHPYGRRRMYVDQDTSWVLYSIIYDRQGNHMKTMLEVYIAPRYSPENADAGIPLLTGEAMINYPKNRATIFRLSKLLHNRPLAAELFTVDEMVSGGH